MSIFADRAEMGLGKMTKWYRRRRRAVGRRPASLAAARRSNESGQSLVIVVIAMVLIVAMAAFSIDVGQWYVARHQAQVVADSAALAAANCLASTKCTQTTSSGDAATVAGDYAAHNVKITGVSFTGSTVKVTTKELASASFAGLFGINSVSTSASATASYSTSTGLKWDCASTGGTNCLSLFAGNDTCPSRSPASNDLGLSLVTNDAGGGNENMTGLYTNGYYYNGADSGSYTVSGPDCHTDSETKPNRTNFTATTATVPYPVVWTKPTCSAANSAASWTTASITAAGGPGIYCVTATPASGACTDTASGSGIISVTLDSLPSGAYEFVGPCVVLAGSNPNVTSINGQPLVYGTSNITSPATTSSLPTCAVNDGSNGTSTWLTGNNISLTGPVFDQCGTFQVLQNKADFIGFVEAWNIILDKNAAVEGNGPTSASNPQVTTLPGTDSLSS